MKATERFAGGLVYGIVRLVSFLPLSVSQVIGRGIGHLNILLNTRSTRVTRTNLELCMPALDDSDREAMVRESVLHTAQMMMETPAAWLGDHKRIFGWIRRIENESLIHDAIKENRGVTIILPHIGNWELANVFLAERISSVTGLYAPPRQPYLRTLMAKVRTRFGNELVPTTVKGIATLFKRVREGKITVVLPDQVPATGKFAPFFGHQALTDVLITRLVAKCNPVVLCCVIKRLPNAQGFDVLISEANKDIYSNDPDVALAGMNLSVEACVHQAPEQYQWEYKRFRERPSGEFRLYNYKNESSEFH